MILAIFLVALPGVILHWFGATIGDDSILGIGGFFVATGAYFVLLLTGIDWVSSREGTHTQYLELCRVQIAWLILFLPYYMWDTYTIQTGLGNLMYWINIFSVYFIVIKLPYWIVDELMTLILNDEYKKSK